MGFIHSYQANINICINTDLYYCSAFVNTLHLGDKKKKGDQAVLVSFWTNYGLIQIESAYEWLAYRLSAY